MSGRSVISIGTFDGVHLGHCAILARARQLAAAQGAVVRALVFDPHPARILRPDAEPPRLTDLEEKRALLREAGADELVVLKPTPALLQQSPTRFIEQLVAEHAPLAIVEGPDFRFGKGREGDLALLERLGQRWDFTLAVEPAIALTLADWHRATVSSSLVRWLIGHGRVVEAASCLGRAFELRGKVVAGERRGRAMGLPTANLDPHAYAEHAVPADGVYAGWVVIGDAPPRPAAMSVGVKPTFGQRGLTIEAHVLDFDDDLYDRTIVMQFVRWIRDQYAFPTRDALLRQLERDVALTRVWHRTGHLDAPTGAGAQPDARGRRAG